jgi:sigma-B regulation protein RsbU (phosphoserine phosphatase)
VDGKLRYCSAGLSDQLLLRRSGERLRLRRSGPMIGLSTQIPFSGEERDFGPGDVLLFFSDGLAEAHDARDAMYGDDRLISVATARRLDGPAAIIADLERDWERFLGDAPAQDDFTMIAVERAIPVPPDAESEAESAPQAGGAARLDVNQDGG